MKKFIAGSGAALLVLLAGCSIIPPDRRATARPMPASLGAELVGRALRVEAGANGVSTMHFRQDGTVRAAFGGRSVDGSWAVANARLCFSWAGTSRECWPYTAPFIRGEARTITSDRGNVVRVTLQ